MRTLPWLNISVMIAMLLGGLILTYYGPAQKTLVMDNQSHQALPKADSLDYHLIMADLAWQRQLWSQAAVHYAVVAQKTQKAEFALMATSAALEAQILPLARQNAELWANIEPTNAKAQALTAALYIAEYNEESAYIYLNQLVDTMPHEALPHLLMIHESLEDPKEQNIFFSLLQRITTIHENQPSIWFVLARQAQSLQYEALALQATNQALLLQPDWVSAIALKVQLLYQAGEKIAARDYLATVTKRLPEEADLQFIYTQINKEISAESL
jgi:predicted Zn-dependent protease